MVRAASLLALALLAGCTPQPKKPTVILGPIVDTPAHAHPGPKRERVSIPPAPPEKPEPAPPPDATVNKQLDAIDRRVRDLRQTLPTGPPTPLLPATKTNEQQ